MSPGCFEISKKMRERKRVKTIFSIFPLACQSRKQRRKAGMEIVVRA
jgi:hypothetical protein